MKKPGDLTNNFLERFNSLVKHLKSNGMNIEVAETFDPVTQEEIDAVETKTGHKLDETFLAYFRESNGYKLRYTLTEAEENEFPIGGGLLIPGLASMFEYHMSTFCEPGKIKLEMLGGRDDHTVRSNLYMFDKHDEFRDSGIYYAVGYLITDNILLFSEDYEAAITDSHPITVGNYMELTLATAALENRREIAARGHEGDFPLINLPKARYEDLESWDAHIEAAKAKLVTPGFVTLTEEATQGNGYYLNYMKSELEDESQNDATNHPFNEVLEEIEVTPLSFDKSGRWIFRYLDHQFQTYLINDQFLLICLFGKSLPESIDHEKIDAECKRINDSIESHYSLHYAEQDRKLRVTGQMHQMYANAQSLRDMVERAETMATNGHAAELEAFCNNSSGGFWSKVIKFFKEDSEDE